MMARILVVVVALLVVANGQRDCEDVARNQEQPCFGTMGYSERGVDIGNSAVHGPFSSMHRSYWNFTLPSLHMRYDVVNQTDLVSGASFSQVNLFLYDRNVSYHWMYKGEDPIGGGYDCTSKDLPALTCECVPNTYLARKGPMVGGLQTHSWVSPDGRAEQVTVDSPVDGRPILLQIISRDAKGTVTEFAQIENFVHDVPGGPSRFHVPSFCL